ncbi:MAG: class I SAM-dependent methyltransferase [Desulfitobacteriaceae bacterium]
MDFYEALSKYYDEIFPIKEQQKKFLQTYINTYGQHSILDVGCGTGSYVLEIASWGIQADGVDLSRAMIDIAKQKAREKASTARFYVGDMQDLNTSVEASYDGIICLGNTIAHLPSELVLCKVLEDFQHKAKQLLIQVVNYDRIIAQKIIELSEIKTPNLVFYRYYTHLPSGLIEFTTKIDLSLNQQIDSLVKTKDEQSTSGKSVLTAVNTLFPLVKNDLEKSLLMEGWEPIHWWGSFAGEEWQEDSPATIVAVRAKSFFQPKHSLCD